MKTFAIFGTVVDTDDMRYTHEDVTPAQFRAVINKLDKGEDLEVQINSPGGSVYAGIAIANMIRQLSIEGHKVTARVEGLAASIASVIACACDRVVMGESSLMMIHNCWSVVQGDSNALRKEAETMDKINEAIISFYLSKFDQTREALKELMNQETWFSGKDAQTFKFNCEVTPDKSDFKIAAMVRGFDLAKFLHTPNALRENIMENKIEDKVKADAVVLDETKHVEEVKEVSAEAKTEEHLERLAKDVEEIDKEVANKVQDEKPADETTEKVEEPVKDSVEDFVPKAEVEKRVSGMQSAMAKQMNDLKKDYEAKIEDFKNQLDAKGKELIDAQAKITSLEDSVGTLTQDKSELSEKISALMAESEERKNALDMLNASVNTPNEKATDWRSLKGKEFFDFVKGHPELVKKN